MRPQIDLCPERKCKWIMNEETGEERPGRPRGANICDHTIVAVAELFSLATTSEESLCYMIHKAIMDIQKELSITKAAVKIYSLYQHLHSTAPPEAERPFLITMLLKMEREDDFIALSKKYKDQFKAAGLRSNREESLTAVK